MPNAHNLVNIVGNQNPKPTKKRNRTKNREAYIQIEKLLQQQANNAKTSAANPVPGAGTAAASQGNSEGGVTSAKSQAPTQRNTAGGGAKQTPNTKSQPTISAAAAASTPQSQKPAVDAAKPSPANQKKQEPYWLTREKLFQWKQFQENLQWNFDSQPKNQNSNKQTISFCMNNKGKNTNTNPNVKKPGNINKTPQGTAGNTVKTASGTANKDTKSEGMAEIKWELNKVDDLDDSAGYSQAQSQTSQVIQGLASEIKLTVKDQRKLIATKESSSQSIAATKPVEVKEQKILGGHKHELNTTAEKRQHPTAAPSISLPRNMPAGVPKSFLTLQNPYGAIQPQRNPNINIPAYEQPPRLQQLLPPAPIHTPVQRSFMGNNSGHPETTQQYSPTEMYDSVNKDAEQREGGDSPELLEGGQKRLSAFHRLGPVSEPKKPKLTINLLCNKDVREVVDDTKKEEPPTPTPAPALVPVHLRQEVLRSTDETVMKYLPWWPWKKNVPIKRSVTARSSKSAMLLEQEQMEEAYEKDSFFFQVWARDYPPHWRKEQVLDSLLDAVRGKSFIPCFIEFTPKFCKFFVIRSKSALMAIHKLGFYVRQDDSEIGITISYTDVSLKQIDFIPRLVLRKILSKRYDSESKLDLEAFTLKEDISHFIYFPLSRPTNQAELTQLQSAVAWEYLTDLNLSRNRLKSIDAFSLESRCPRLKKLDLSHNCLERVTSLLRCRELPIKSLKLEGNPLCHDYTDPDHYVRVVRMMFPGLAEIDGLPIKLTGELPRSRRHYCPEGARQLVEQFLEVFFPLLDSEEERAHVEDLYGGKAIMTITFRSSARSYLYRHFRNLMVRARSLEAGEPEAVEGAAAVGKLVGKWPPLAHDPATFTTDVLHHTDFLTILRVSGILKLTSDSLAKEEPLLAFTRTVVLTSRSGAEFKIQNEMVHWDEPTPQYADIAFQVNSVRPKRLSLKFESPPDKETKESLVHIFSKITELDKETSERCLELKEWNMKIALEHFMKLVKLDCLDSLKKTETNRDNKT